RAEFRPSAPLRTRARARRAEQKKAARSRSARPLTPLARPFRIPSACQVRTIPVAAQTIPWMDQTGEHEFGVPFAGAILPRDRWTQTALKRYPEGGPINWAGLFGRSAPVVLDIGCGNGRFLLASAVARPECDHLGVDTLPVVIRYARRRGNQRGLTNLK